MVYLLSIGFTLLVVALKLALLKRTIRRRRRENLYYSGLWLMVISVVVAIVGGVAGRMQWLSSQEVNVLANTAIAIMITGFIPAVEGTILLRRREAQLNVLCRSIFAIALVGIASIIGFIITRN
jgi:hypothetical protein